GHGYGQRRAATTPCLGRLRTKHHAPVDGLALSLRAEQMTKVDSCRVGRPGPAAPPPPTSRGREHAAPQALQKPTQHGPHWLP
ncbi:hypothetical protein, partial [Nocardia abscessus]|uniref:hypothetical protein n=1 Tax=Nocardia abscessus TaxID=120957 RepID=UPI00245727A2